MGFIYGMHCLVGMLCKADRATGTVTIFQYGAGQAGVMRTLGKYMVASGGMFGYEVSLWRTTTKLTCAQALYGCRQHHSDRLATNVFSHLSQNVTDPHHTSTTAASNLEPMMRKNELYMYPQCIYPTRTEKVKPAFFGLWATAED